MTGVAAVGIAPEHRGGGIASALMHAALREMHAEGVALSALYPATIPLYRRVGYEHAGVRDEVQIALRPLRIKAGEASLNVRRIKPKDHEAIAALYRSRAAHADGYLDRPEIMWQRVRAPRGDVAQGFMAVSKDSREPEGYLYYLQKPSQDAAYLLHLTDMVAATPAAGRSLLRFLADHRSMADQAIVHGNEDDPILKLLPERYYKSRLLDHWMLRIVDIRAALAKRGYPAGLAAEIHLDVRDELIKPNNRRWVLGVENGKPRLQGGGRGELIIDIRGLAAMYSGHLSPYELISIGLLNVQARGKRADAALAAATAVFAGSRPSMPDMF